MRSESGRAAEPAVRSILLVDDDPAFVGIVRHVLRDAPTGTFDVEAVETLAEAEEALAGAAGYDAVLLDFGLPDSLGVESVSRIVELAGETPVIVVSGGFESVVEGALDAGAVDVVHKDRAVSDDHLVRALQATWDRRRSADRR